jgi:hypothetical protein
MMVFTQGSFYLAEKNLLSRKGAKSFIPLHLNQACLKGDTCERRATGDKHERRTKGDKNERRTKGDKNERRAKEVIIKV